MRRLIDWIGGLPQPEHSQPRKTGQTSAAAKTGKVCKTSLPIFEEASRSWSPGVVRLVEREFVMKAVLRVCTALALALPAVGCSTWSSYYDPYTGLVYSGGYSQILGGLTNWMARETAHWRAANSVQGHRAMAAGAWGAPGFPAAPYPPGGCPCAMGGAAGYVEPGTCGCAQSAYMGGGCACAGGAVMPGEWMETPSQPSTPKESGTSFVPQPAPPSEASGFRNAPPRRIVPSSGYLPFNAGGQPATYPAEPPSLQPPASQGAWAPTHR